MNTLVGSVVLLILCCLFELSNMSTYGSTSGVCSGARICIGISKELTSFV